MVIMSNRGGNDGATFTTYILLRLTLKIFRSTKTVASSLGNCSHMSNEN